MNILVLTPYAPWPAYGGGTMRIYQLVRGLANKHTVTGLSFVSDGGAAAALADALPKVTWHTIIGPAVRKLWQRSFDTLFHPWPDMALRNHDHAYYVRLHELCEANKYDLVVGFSIEMVPYLGIAKSYGYATHYDTFNAEHVIQKRAFLTDIRVPRRWHAALYSLLQWYKLARYERRTMRAVDGVSVVSHGDAAMLQRSAEGTPLAVVPNGVDTEYFAPQSGPQDSTGVPTIVFSGTLDYRANIDAVRWFVGEVLPLIRATMPLATFVVVGRRPSAALQALADEQVLQLTGEVVDTRPYLSRATVYVVPMRIGGGVRLKVLEALAMELPVVSTQMGAEGIDGMPTGILAIADDPRAFADAVCAVLAAPQQNVQGRAFVQRAYDWRVIVPGFVESLQSTIRHAADA
jgi:glycosyltransferase involved in cell wall biosynthesis